MKKRPLCVACILFLAIQTVRVWFFGAGGQETSALEQALEKDCKVILAGTVYRIEEKENVTAVFLRDSVLSVAHKQFSESKLMVYVRPKQQEKNNSIKIGNQVKVSGEASSFERARNPGNFDRRSYYLRQGIRILVWAEHTSVLSSRPDRIRQFLSDVREGWKEILTEHLGDYYGGIMSAILLGDKSGLDPEMKKLYQKNGIGHLLAISGLHMSFIGMGIYSLLRKSGLGFIPAGLAGGSILIFYTVMIGAGVSSLRALIMFLVKIGADLTGRDYDLLTSLALSAAVLCGQQPLYVTDAGFLLSFGAILGIALIGPMFAAMLGCDKKEGDDGERAKKKKPGSRRRPKAILVVFLRKLSAGLASSLAVNVLLLGPVLYFYFEIPSWSVFLNLVVIPIMPLAMGAGIAGSALTLLSDVAGGAVLKLSQGVLWFYDMLCGMAVELPGSRIVTGKPSVKWLIIYYGVLLGMCILFYFLRHKNKFLLPVPGGCILIFAVIMTVMCRAGYRNEDGVQVTVLDVGQGDAIHIRGAERNYLIDGGSSDVSSPGIYRIEPYLLAGGVDTLDYVFVTHGDEDHINGIQELLEGQRLGVRIRNLVLPAEEYWDEKLTELAGTAAENGTRVAVIKAGDIIKEQGEQGLNITLTCLGPGEGLGFEPGNEASLVMELTCGEFGMLLAGDVEGEGEKTLISGDRIGQYDILKAAHHGSKNSSMHQFLDIVQPSVALISAGRDNRYGHPHKETLERFAGIGTRVYSTQENGAITVWTDGKKMRLTGMVPKEQP